jgi:hypothetical protein
LNTASRLLGVFPPVITPFSADLSVRDCRWLMLQKDLAGIDIHCAAGGRRLTGHEGSRRIARQLSD